MSTVEWLGLSQLAVRSRDLIERVSGRGYQPRMGEGDSGLAEVLPFPFLGLVGQGDGGQCAGPGSDLKVVIVLRPVEGAEILEMQPEETPAQVLPAFG